MQLLIVSVLGSLSLVASMHQRNLFTELRPRLESR
jgi:hypothetical protein